MTSPAINARVTPRDYLPRSLKGWALLILNWRFGLCAFLSLALLSWLLARSTPSWYAPLDPQDIAVLDNADRAQHKLLTGLNNTLQAVPLGEQRWTITQDEINSMIAARLATSDLNPDGSTTSDAAFSNPVVVFTPGKITLAVRAKKAPGNHPNGGVVSVTLSVRNTQFSTGDPAAQITLDSAWIGNLPIPKSLVENNARSYAPKVLALIQQSLAYKIGGKDAANMMPQIHDATALFLEGSPFPMSFSFNRRKIVVKAVKIEDGSLTLIFIPPTTAAVRPR